MTTLDEIRSGLIDKILTITNREFLGAFDILISTCMTDSGLMKLTDVQKAMLEMSEDDIKAGRLISKEAMEKRNLEWLNEH